MAEQVLAALERRYHRQRLALVIMVFVLLLSTIYFARDSFRGPGKIVSMSQQQAETTDGIKLAANTASTPLRSGQSEETAHKIREVHEQGTPPDEVLTVRAADVQTAATQAVDRNKADFAILIPPGGQSPAQLPPDQKLSLQVYSIRAYPKSMLGIGVGKMGADISYLRRVDIAKLPLLLPKGGVGYIGPYIKAGKNGGSDLDYGVRMMIPL